MERTVTFLGVLIGDDKYSNYSKNDVFCFPSFYESESFPVVLLEASSFALPIVSTWWRGIPSIVTDGDNGFLVPVKDAHSVAEKLEILINDRAARAKMGARSRQLYVENYTLEKFHKNIETALCT